LFGSCEEETLTSSTTASADVKLRWQCHSRPPSNWTSMPAPRSLSFYDNLCLGLDSQSSSADPQSELELILDDLRRNISALDAALSSTSPSNSSNGSTTHSLTINQSINQSFMNF